ncbi:MAG: Smr/MutS family protein [Burkholderiaceae bacterium]|nr:Smr/MutS family protein [Burkholderiaceae bacterium]
MRRATPLKALQDLQDLKRTLAKGREEAAALAAAREAERQRLLHEQELFTRTVGPVTPLVAAIRAELRRTKPAPEPRQREQDEQQALRQALSDDFDVDSLLETDEALSFRRTNISQEVVRKLRRGHWSLQGQIDLHGLRRDEARESLGEFIHHAARTGMRCVRVVHGKGNGSPGREPVLKARVRRWLVQKQEVLAFTQARASEGGNGALIVLLQGAS